MATMSERSEQRPGAGLDPWLVDLYRSEYRRLVRLAALLVDEVGEAEEIVQDAFIATSRAHRTGSVLDPTAMASYLRSAVANGARSRLRKRRVRRRHLRSVAPPPTAPPADVETLESESTREVLDALRTLPERQRAVLVLRYYGDLSEAEIADALGITTGTVKTHAHRGLAALEDRLAP